MIILFFRKYKKCSLVVVDVFSTKAFIFAAIIIFLCFLFKISFIPVFRGGGLIETYKKYPFLFKILFGNSVTIVCPSKSFYIFFKSKGFQVKYISNYIDIQNYSFRLRRAIKPKILWVRSIHEIYNPVLAINVLKNIKRKFPKATLCFVGPIKDKYLMKSLQILISDLKLEDSISFTGKLSKKKWIKLSESYDIFLNTTNYDNNPVTLLEAMALGLPIVTTNVGGIPKLVDNKVTGLLVEPNDIFEMVNILDDLLSDKIDFMFIIKSARKKAELIDKKIILDKWFKLIGRYV